MLDTYLTPHLRRPLRKMAHYAEKIRFTADKMSLTGFLFALFTFFFLLSAKFYPALFCILFNRLCDGLDGTLARRQSPQQKSDAGSFLDITLDFLFYGIVPLGFICANPPANAVAGGFLLFSFIANGTAFLAFAAAAGRRGLESPHYPEKGFYYLSGLAEGSETILCFILCCLLPDFFAVIAGSFAIICFISALCRVYWGYITLCTK